MSVFGTFRIDIRPYSGYQAPRLPVASWIAQSGQVGDASGGIVRANFLFELEGGVRITELFNIEQMAVDMTSTTARQFHLATVNMDTLAPTRQASPQIWSLITEAGINNFDAMDPRRLAGLPLWLGAPASDAPAGDKGVSVTFANVDLLLYAVTLQGYMWGPRAVLAEGGPRRPVGGFFR